MTGSRECAEDDRVGCDASPATAQEHDGKVKFFFYLFTRMELRIRIHRIRIRIRNRHSELLKKEVGKKTVINLQF
jgi:hypothetical protein